MSEATQKFQATLEAFIASPDFKISVLASTRASWGGGLYKVELFDNGTWLLHWNQQPRRLRLGECPGLMLDLPTVDDSDLNEYLADRLGTSNDYLE